ncbi:MAG: PHP-associated domain-containing protein [Candidatus Odinarchaeia archaeon]
MLKIDFHVHTHYSKCAISSPKEIIKFAIKKNLEGIAITDHDSVKGLKKALKLKPKILIIPGIEVNSLNGDIIGLGIQERIPQKRSVEETIEMIRDAGGLALIPHPFDILRNSIGFKLLKITPKIKPDLIEIYNSNMLTPFGNLLAERYCNTNNYKTTAGSDAHSCWEVGSAYTYVENGTVDDVLNYIIKHKAKFYGTPPDLKFTLLRKIRSKFR